jgi:2-hydroxycyclohexanecarboxyl-CoA dehydrogenase
MDSHTSAMTSDKQTPRVALVTGGARGIGRGIAELLAREGHRVAIGDIRDDDAAEVAAQTGAVAVHLDVTDTPSVRAGVATIEEQLGPIEIVVNNAGWDALVPFLDTDEEFWDQLIEVNFKGCLRTCRELVPGMTQRGFGRVINIASDAARVGSSFEAVYAGTKGGVVSFTKTLAREVARHGVTANAVCPGPTQTPLLEEMLAASAQSANIVESVRRAVPMRRLGSPDDIAAAVAFLAADRAGYITGQTLSVSGGLTMA